MSRPDIFGIGLAGLLDDAFQAAQGSFPITVRRRAEGARVTSTGGKTVTTSDYPARGFMDTRERTIEGGAEVTGSVFVIFGASLPAGFEPLPGDDIISATEGKTFRIRAGEGTVIRDPAGATYICQVGP